MKISLLWSKFQGNLFQVVQIMITQHNGLSVRHQAITWINCDLVYWRLYASLGIDELSANNLLCYLN